MFAAPFLLFIVLQGGVVFLTAWFGARLLEMSSIGAKLGLMTTSYVAWVAFTWGGFYVMSGSGGGALMDGFGFTIALSITALVSSFFYTVVWALVSIEKVKGNA